MKKITIGILAHVDAGKTTLSEALLYSCGAIRQIGRVDNQDAFLDTNQMERDRGITIFSKQAVFEKDDTRFTLLDTPGHVDFSAEMERTLQVLDYAVLVVGGADGVQGHTKTLWRLLKQYQIPVFFFINKMDLQRAKRNEIMQQLMKELDGSCVDFTNQEEEEFFENIGVNDEEALEKVLENGSLSCEELAQLIDERKIFPCFFGSALKVEGVEELIDGLVRYTKMPTYPNEFGARVYKIARDQQGNRLTYVKVTGGLLKMKDLLEGEGADGEPWSEKVNQIRIYHGERFEAVSEAEAGEICTLLGLTKTFPGEGLGFETETALPILEPVLTYQVELPDDVDAAWMLPKLKELEEEEPELHILWNETSKEIKAQVMGEVQMEILEREIMQRFQVKIHFGMGSIVYKETIVDTVEGVGHFEPLRHYAEVHLLLEPLPLGSGIEFAVDCSEDILDKNWQRLILTHLAEKNHKGVLVGGEITDLRITLIGGRAHLKHTEGGDFRQATYRAVRQGLRKATSRLLEPFYEFRLELPAECIGRAMTDIEKMKGTMDLPSQEGEFSILTGMAPVSLMQDYQREVVAYTHGKGKIFCSLKGYGTCHNEEEVIAASGYDPEADLANPTGSVFCAHGAGFVVDWDKVEDYMHVEASYQMSEEQMEEIAVRRQQSRKEEVFVGTEEIDAILERAHHANRKNSFVPHKGIARKKSPKTILPVTRTAKKPGKLLERYLLVDGYNIIFAWKELNELSKDNIDGARGKLMDILCDYQAMKKCELILVFDAYQVKGHDTEIMDYHNIHVVYTKEAETADQYIEKFAHENGKKYDVTVATSDGLEQIIIRGAGCHLLSAKEFEREVAEMKEYLRNEYLKNS